jgi:hypothetical protein
VNQTDIISNAQFSGILVDLAAIATIIGGAIAISQLFSIASELRKRPKIDVVVRPQLIQPWDGNEARLQLDVRSTNRGARTAHNLLWNYAFPAGCVLLDQSAVGLHQEDSGLVVVRSQDYLHPEVTLAHRIGVRVGPPFGVEQSELRLEWTLNLQDEKPRREVVQIPLMAEHNQ